MRSVDEEFKPLKPLKTRERHGDLYHTLGDGDMMKRIKQKRSQKKSTMKNIKEGVITSTGDPRIDAILAQAHEWERQHGSGGMDNGMGGDDMQMEEPLMAEGIHTEIDEQDDNLRIVLTNEGRREARNLVNLPVDEAMAILLKEHIDDGYLKMYRLETGNDVVPVPVIGIGNKLNKIFAFEDYKTKSELNELLAMGEINLAGTKLISEDMEMHDEGRASVDIDKLCKEYDIVDVLVGLSGFATKQGIKRDNALWHKLAKQLNVCADQVHGLSRKKEEKKMKRSTSKAPSISREGRPGRK